ncbi:TolC family protein [Psychrobacter fozii]|uniref:Adhesin transport system outer membrane protein n=1 Tax=Psychrobacter fozii TaxID=198480 RepID=A0A2V4UII6_9GAMM|nr:TolC family protein [Psychrobacter fozii]PYE36416.1 adhesin transport system outer membrane protein [Psychrobacter fozii]
MVVVAIRRYYGVAFSLLLMSLSSAAFAAESDGYMNTLISQAIQTHPLVGSARAEQQATTESIRAAKLNMLPEPSVSSGYDNDDGQISQLQIRQSLWTGGKLTADINQAIFDDKAATETVYEKQNEVAKTTIEAWQSYMTAVSQQQVYYDNLQLLAEFEEMMKRRVSQGVSARIDMDLVANRILQEQNSYQGTVEQQRIAIARLEQITGRRISPTELPAQNLTELVSRAKSYSQDFEKMAFDQASFYNPTVVKEQYQVEAAKQGVKSQQASSYPTLYAQYAYDYYHEDDSNSEGAFSVGLSYNPGAGFSSLALARASASRVNSLEQSKEASRRLVLETIQTQYQQFASAKDQERSLIAAVAGAQIVVSSYRRQFIAGRKSWLEVLNAVREHSQYQAQLVEIQTSIIAAYYKLQVDFGLMSWQQYGKSRESQSLYRPLDPVKNWLKSQESTTPRTESSVTQPIIMKDKDMVTYPIDDSYDAYDYPSSSGSNTGLLTDIP